MAEKAHTLAALEADLRAQLPAGLCAAMPETAPELLFTAFVLARHRYGARDLARHFRLTPTAPTRSSRTPSVEAIPVRDTPSRTVGCCRAAAAGPCGRPVAAIPWLGSGTDA
ncbi:hypothetical protein GTS_54240 [Gandjariella thermophila]|uniref:Uncharacterized protein n=1 Tax=Gandjariella thermophila TaxID=1931992 RepID=A0A4D4JAV6_9PSEU|nr:hypothetical protein GTS_54240 [Gandjariella thermophila]